ncbi:MAG: hypothetical protein QW757_05740 [Candidatus Woesearchaeota archaeon]
MGWKQIAKSNDLIIFEKSLKNYKIKIEARKNYNYWEIFKIKISGEKTTILSQYRVSEDELKEYLKKLKSTKKEIEKEENFVSNKLDFLISLKRIFKEEFTEKWEFSINKEDKNFVLINFEDDLVIDIVMNKRYINFETKILNQIKQSLGFDEISSNTEINIYYYEKSNFYKEDIMIFDDEEFEE